MKLYLKEKNILTKFNLNEEIDGSFLFTHTLNESGREISINVDAEDNSWVLKSNGNTNITNGKMYISSVKLDNYMIVPIYVRGLDYYLYIYTFPSFENVLISYYLDNLTEIKIGSDDANNIVYKINGTSLTHAIINKEDDYWYIKPFDEKCEVYVNNLLIEEKSRLLIGDIIFINGLKIVWMGLFLKITNSNNKYNINGFRSVTDVNTIDKNEYLETPDDLADYASLINKNFFSHTPRIKNIGTEYEVKIDAPPQRQDLDEGMPLILSMASSMAMLSMSAFSAINIVKNVKSGESTIADNMSGIIMFFSMLLSTLILPIVINMWQKNHKKKKERKRQKKYKNYLQKKEEKIQFLMKKQNNILNENFPNIKDCENIVIHKNQNLWNRKIEDDDFLQLRVGVGSKLSDIKIITEDEKFSLDDDNLQDMVFKLRYDYKIANNIPIIYDLKKDRISTLIINGKYRQKFIDTLLLQIIAFHSPNDLKIVVLTDKYNENNWNYIKYLPHNTDDEKTIRFFASEQEEYRKITKYLDEELANRCTKKKDNEENGEDFVEENFDKKRDNYKSFEPYYLIISDDYNQIKDFQCIQNILENKLNYGISLFIIDDSMKHLPKECQTFLCVSDSTGGLFEGEIKEDEMDKFNIEYDETLSMRKMAMMIGEIPIQGKNAEYMLPTSLEFLEMFNVGKIEQLNVRNRWKKSEPMKSLSTTIGVHKNGELFKLDLHEKYEGPHGLIAGTTGSGKSEFIITYVLSLALNYDPREVQFILIDYKGGGLAGAFENRDKGIAIPHLAGTITNLDTAEMNRTLVSIQSELKRRQSKFNEVREALGESTMEIYKYQRLYREGVIEEPMSHLFIICDEFAELKAQQPDFMENLISASRIGRSLGIHLILATQKPSGVVNDQIWSNSKFKVCLKVASRADSQEMLKRPEAASIKEAGRFYLQVGYDEYFDIGQSGWSGAKYIPVERIVKKEDDSIIFIDNCANTIKSINNIAKKDTSNEANNNGDQLTNIVMYLNNIAKEDGIKRNTLWLPSLRKKIMCDSLLEKYSFNNNDFLNVVLGEYDAPSKQKQGLLTINFVEDGNLLIYGIPGSGKDFLMSSIIYNSCNKFSPKELEIYIADFGAETLKGFKKFPHVGDVITLDDKQLLDCMLKMLNTELENRKKKYSDFGGSYLEYRKISKEVVPFIMIFINNFEIFCETYSRISEAFDQLFRDGSKYGISFVVSTTASNVPRSRVAQNFPNKVCMKMAKNDDYRDLLNSPRGLVPVENYGRGLIALGEDETYEFQTAMFVEKENRTKFLIDKTNELTQKWNGYKVKNIPILPDIVTIENIKNELKGLGCFPIGIEKNTLEAYTYNFLENKINLIVGKSIKNHIYFVYALIKEMQLLKNVNINIIDSLRIYRGNYENVKVYNENIEEGFLDAYNKIQNDDKQDNYNVYICLGISEFKNMVSKKYSKYFSILFDNIEKCKKTIFLLLDDYDGIKRIQSEVWYKNNVKNTNGIWLGEDIGSQVALGVMSLSMEDKSIQFPCIGYPIYNGNHMIIKYVVDGVDENEK